MPRQATVTERRGRTGVVTRTGTDKPEPLRRVTPGDHHEEESKGETVKNLKPPVVGLSAAALFVGVVVPLTTAQAANHYQYAGAVDGDTVQLGNGEYVRLLGYDTPEVGTCGYWAAKSKMASLVSGGVKLVNRSGQDRYGRILAYVKTRDGRDIGTVMLRRGLAIARYDGLDGYGWHPKQSKYRKLDRKNGTIGC